jgi:hypothetical protein
MKSLIRMLYRIPKHPQTTKPNMYKTPVQPVHAEPVLNNSQSQRAERILKFSGPNQAEQTSYSVRFGPFATLPPSLEKTYEKT